MIVRASTSLGLGTWPLGLGARSARIQDDDLARALGRGFPEPGLLVVRALDDVQLAEARMLVHAVGRLVADVGDHHELRGVEVGVEVQDVREQLAHLLLPPADDEVVLQTMRIHESPASLEGLFQEEAGNLGGDDAHGEHAGQHQLDAQQPARGSHRVAVAGA